VTGIVTASPTSVISFFTVIWVMVSDSGGVIRVGSGVVDQRIIVTGFKASAEGLWRWWCGLALISFGQWAQNKAIKTKMATMPPMTASSIQVNN
jgi:hypothetical protein